jgi:hypothetical protein
LIFFKGEKKISGNCSVPLYTKPKLDNNAVVVNSEDWDDGKF